MKTSIKSAWLAILSFVLLAIALYACAGEKHHDRSGPASPEAQEAARPDRDYPFDIVRDGDDLVMTGARPLRARFTNDAAIIVRPFDGARVSFHAARLGRATTPVASRALLPRSAEPHRITNDRVAIARGEVLEWYEQTVNGLEQGFTLARRPSGGGHLELDVAVADEMRVVASKEAGALVLERRTDGTPCFGYGALGAKDATGQTLHASMSAIDPQTIRIDVEDANATYPITIDPLVWALQTKLTRLEAEAPDQLGRGIAIDGDTIIVGMNGHNGFRGGSVVFREDASFDRG